MIRTSHQLVGAGLMEGYVKRFMMALAGAMLAIAGMQVSANAATVGLGDVTNSSVTQLVGTSGPISDDVTFSLTHESTVTLTLANEFVPGFFNIVGLLATSPDFTFTGTGPFSFAGVLAAGDYLIHVVGTGNGAKGGLYSVGLTAAATPIPGALLLFMTAIGGMGFLGLRRRGSAAA